MARGMSRISTHILDLARGGPATGIGVQLEHEDDRGNWRTLTSMHTDHDGRCVHVLANAELSPGVYRLRIEVAGYFAQRKVESLYPFVEVTFQVRGGESNFHIPLLLSPAGYTTYRGT
jgi:5-hydroxyisourate hydrolase